MGLRITVEATADGEWINDEFEAIFTNIKQGTWPSGGKVWRATLLDAEDTNFKVSLASNTMVPGNYEGCVVTCKGKGWKRKDYNGIALSVGPNGEFERIGKTAHKLPETEPEAKPDQKIEYDDGPNERAAASRGEEIAPSSGGMVSFEDMLKCTAGITHGMAINNAVLLYCADTAKYSKIVEERGLKILLHQLSTSILEISVHLDRGELRRTRSTFEKKEMDAKEAKEAEKAKKKADEDAALAAKAAEQAAERANQAKDTSTNKTPEDFEEDVPF